MLKKIFGFGSGSDVPLGYNRGVTTVTQSNSGNNSSVGEASVGDITEVDVNDNDNDHSEDETPLSARSQASHTASERSTASRQSQQQSSFSQWSQTSKKMQHDSIAGNNNGAHPQKSTIGEGFDEDDEDDLRIVTDVGKNGPDLRGLSIPERVKVVDVWRLNNMSRQEFWEMRKKLYAHVPLGPLRSSGINDGGLPLSLSSNDKREQMVKKEKRKSSKMRIRMERVELYRKTHTEAETGALEMQLKVQAKLRKDAAQLMDVDAKGKRKKTTVKKPTNPPTYD